MFANPDTSQAIILFRTRVFTTRHKERQKGAARKQGEHFSVPLQRRGLCIATPGFAFPHFKLPRHVGKEGKGGRGRKEKGEKEGERKAGRQGRKEGKEGREERKERSREGKE